MASHIYIPIEKSSRGERRIFLRKELAVDDKSYSLRRLLYQIVSSQPWAHVEGVQPQKDWPWKFVFLPSCHCQGPGVLA